MTIQAKKRLAREGAKVGGFGDAVQTGAFVIANVATLTFGLVVVGVVLLLGFVLFRHVFL